MKHGTINQRQVQSELMQAGTKFIVQDAYLRKDSRKISEDRMIHPTNRARRSSTTVRTCTSIFQSMMSSSRTKSPNVVN
ncbi:MAG: hypothetical protein LH606_03240 [Cytophagaceae bacterium]|nr:hypothetical protein [Cytophagaceae bacterium]